MLAPVSGCKSPLLSTLLSAIEFDPTVELERICGGIQHGTTAPDGTRGSPHAAFERCSSTQATNSGAESQMRRVAARLNPPCAMIDNRLPAKE